jgi:lipopolysaccharide biosynthesis regulator YciM
LLGVARHNQMDLRGLAALFGKINELLAAESMASEEMPSLDLFGLSKFLYKRGERVRAHSTCGQALDMGLPEGFHSQALREFALMAKRQGEHDRAAEIWHALAGDEQDGMQACEQLAIYYERRLKNHTKALEFARRAHEHSRTDRRGAGPNYPSQLVQREDAAIKRIKRLERRLAASDGGLLGLATGTRGGLPGME